MENRAPICLFVFNKIHLIDKVLKSIQENKNFKKHNMYIFSDSNLESKDKEKITKLRLKLIAFQRKHKNVNIIFRKKNFGLKKNIIFGVNQIIKKYKRIIVIEDDLILAKNFIDYMEDNLHFYKNKKKVFSISGYSPNIIKKSIKNYNYSNFFSHATSSWGWATWADRWKLFKPIYKVDANKLFKAKKLFNLCIKDNFFSFKDINVKKRDLWAANFNFASLNNNKLNSFPIISKVSNIGFDGTGQGGISSKFSQQLNSSKKKNKLSDQIIVDKNIDRKFIKYHRQNYFLRILKYYLPLSFKRFLKKIIRWASQNG